ncbi:MAG TPA: BA14K family protein [Pseudolabrys sp.]|nr:BA14K family protein [Pseudolabrys sp.]
MPIQFSSKVMAIMLGLSTAIPAYALPLSASSTGIASMSAQSTAVEQVQHRGSGGRGPGPGYRGGYRGGGHRGGGGDGGAVAAGVLGGLLLGAIIANSAQQQRGADYCARRYRSYDPYSGTYLGYDGYRHPCP